MQCVATIVQFVANSVASTRSIQTTHDVANRLELEENIWETHNPHEKPPFFFSFFDDFRCC